jgi:hypothetical protein
MNELEYTTAFGYTKTFDLEAILQALLGTPKAGSVATDITLNEFVSMTYDPPPAYFGIPSYTSDRQTALDFFGSDLADPSASALDICINGIAKRIAAGERFVWGTA